MIKVLQLNVRLSEGGAARVANVLAHELSKLGYENTFAYGYGSRGRMSPHHEDQRCMQVSRPFEALGNLVTHHLTGRESRTFSRGGFSRLAKNIGDFDILHLHVMHSYFLETSRLMDLVELSSGKIVWTQHDSWLLTGRCALPGNCQKWKSGCGQCPNRSAYPPSWLDRTDSGWLERRELIFKIQEKADLQFVTCAKWLQRAMENQGFSPVQTIRNSVDSTFKKSVIPRTHQANSVTKYLFMLNDLRDSRRINVEVLQYVAKCPRNELTVIGNSAPKDLGTLKVMSGISDRAQLAQIFSRHDRLLFFSKIDHYPLTVVEALVSGLEVLAIDSPAAREFAFHPNMSIFANITELMEYVSSSKPKSLRREELEIVNSDFSQERMGRMYSSIYKRLLDL